MRAYRRLYGGAISNVALTTIEVPANTRWQVREFVVSNAGAGGAAYMAIQPTNNAGTVALTLMYLKVGASPDTQRLESHLILEAGEKLSVFGSVAGLYALIDGIVYEPA